MRKQWPTVAQETGGSEAAPPATLAPRHDSRVTPGSSQA
ncbi:hypothetical protein AcdelDRAFT_4428 [Acidovorax delafieldii 2AN]|uniref:Uncharacterized protein n=1 Tax=Acidovorax delafieldii 2AN TaxID=573060 RepID=C5TBZ8_ACIDE|nr:hypothetical protein AcdelDRAFT_4428 [Acidovorax delafieldii 2AN]